MSERFVGTNSVRSKFSEFVVDDGVTVCRVSVDFVNCRRAWIPKWEFDMQLAIKVVISKLTNDIYLW